MVAIRRAENGSREGSYDVRKVPERASDGLRIGFRANRGRRAPDVAWRGRLQYLSVQVLGPRGRDEGLTQGRAVIPLHPQGKRWSS